MPRPRVLFFSPFALERPSTGGARRARLYRDLLGERADVEIFYHCRPTPALSGDELAGGALTVRWFGDRFADPRLPGALERVIGRFEPQAIWAEQLYALPLIARAARRHRLPLVYNSHNVELQRFAAWSPLHQALVYPYERLCLGLADHVACVSARDRRSFARLYGARLAELIVVLPNGYDEVRFKPAATGDHRRVLRDVPGLAPETPLAIFFGQYRYRPNAGALERIERAIAPRLRQLVPEARLLILGPGLDAARRGRQVGNLVYVGDVADVVPYLQAADLSLCPLAHSAGTPLKIIESLACGLPVLSTPEGGAGLADLGEESGLHRSPLEGFAERAAALLVAPRPVVSISRRLVEGYSRGGIRPRLEAFTRRWLSPG